MPKDPKEFANLAKELQGSMIKLTSVMAGMDSLFDSMVDKSSRVSKTAKEQSAEYQKGGKELAGIRDLNADLKKTLEDQIKSQQIKTLAFKTGLATEIVELQVVKQLALAEAQRAGASNEMLTKIRQQYDEAVKLTKEKLKQDKMLEHEEEIAKKIAEYDEERKEALAGITAKANVLKDIFTDQRVAAAMFTNQLFKAYNQSKELFSEVRKEGFTVGQAFHETGLAMSDAFSLGGTSGKDSLEVMKGMRSEMGSIEKVTSDARREAASLAKTFGISNEEAGKLTAQFAVMPGATMESANNSLEFAGNLAKAAGVAPGEVMKDIANSAEDVASYSKDGGKNIAVAAVAAKKLGVDFGTITKAAEGLLDFESSINKQMEASVLLGREINLDKAREAALNGDLVGATQEMLKNVGGEAEFNKMNVMQRKALAESMGVSVQDLAKMVKNQDELTNLTEEQQQALATGEMSMDEALANAGGFADKMFEGAKTVGSMVIGFGEIGKGLKEAGEFSKSLFGGIMGGLKGMSGGGGIKGGLKGALGMDKTPEIPKTDGVDKASKLKTGGGFKSAMKDLAGGFKEMGGADVLKGIINTAIAGPALIVALPSIPFLLFMGLTPLKLLKSNFMGLAGGLSKMGTGEVAMGSLNLMLFGVAGVIGVAAIPFLAFIAFAGQFVGAGLKGLASGMSALAKPQVALGALILMGLVLSLGASIMMMGIGIGIAAAGLSLMFKELANMPLEKMMLLPIALQLMGIGLLTLGVAALVAAPGVFFATLALAGFAAVLALMQPIMAMGGLQALADGLTAISASAGGLTQVGLAVMGIGAGLGMMALAGLMALPVIGALIGLAAVAPALGALGSIFGGGEEGGEKEDKMQLIADKLDQLIAVASKGGEINMDGRKVGEIVRLGLNTSNVR